MKLEFDPDRGYKGVVGTKFLSIDDYLTQPVIVWCHKNIGPIHWPKDVNEVLQGEGWEIAADWEGYLNGIDKPRTYVIIHTSISDKLVTDFWIRFQ